MEYYQDVITQKSWKILQELQKKIRFILIGGWAVWLYTHTLKSKDIDIIVGYDTLSTLRKHYDIVKNERLKKYEAKIAEVDIDIYLPHYSNPGAPSQYVQKHRTIKEGFYVPKPEMLLILKQYAYERRKASIKGEKDKIDIISLLQLDLDFSFYKTILAETSCHDLAVKLEELLKKTTRILELGLGNHTMAVLKRKVIARLG